ncbi:DUF2057 family protein [Vibrio sp. SS-MA-C1-2]|uniref:YccT family protein n=1 Tax=Vibrio sp. SS-MA-C1-2 TaxID=2908646 RepID=UPI001F27B4BC|nr:DUF2057 family protein [Vibrio sp. SS-MA-C1-2]UJF20013.1 DUF2057 family protein [Vibrio sp. SS-MA-C1-2]
MNLKKLSLLCASLTAITSFSSLAEVELKLPTSADILVINGHKASNDFFNTKSKLKLPDGTQQIVFRYDDSYGRGDNAEQFTSDTIIIKFQATNDTVKLALPRINDNFDFTAFNKKPSVTLTDSSGQNIRYEVNKLMQSGFQLNRNYQQEMLAFNQTAASAAAPSFVTMPVATVPVATATVATTAAVTTSAASTAPVVQQVPASAQTTEEQMLHFWYQKADAATKARFKAFVNGQ